MTHICGTRGRCVLKKQSLSIDVWTNLFDKQFDYSTVFSSLSRRHQLKRIFTKENDNVAFVTESPMSVGGEYSSVFEQLPEENKASLCNFLIGTSL